MSEPDPTPHPSSPRPSRRRLLAGLALALVLLGGAYLRLVGLEWDQGTHLHPDERFLTMVAAAISAPGSLAEHLDTERSPANPHNHGFNFFVYGTLPLFLTRAAGEVTGDTGYDGIHLVGRRLAAGFDLVAVLLVYLLALRLSGRRPVALLAAAFYATAVLPVQLSHFFAVDPFASCLMLAALLLAVASMTGPWRRPNGDRLRGLALAAGFGLAVGLAMASKISAAPAALLLPAAAALTLAGTPREERRRTALRLAGEVAAAALVALVAFRLAQPYAFVGPGFFNLRLNPEWLADLREVAALSSGRVDFPPALQWARRPLSFAWTNMVRWGLGPPLGLLAWVGLAWAAVRAVRLPGPLALITGWTAAFFIWQATAFTRAMRYQLPVYPVLAVLAALAIGWLWQARGRWLPRRRARRIAAAVAALVLTATAAWAYAFTRIYTRPPTRAQASRWMYEHVRPALTLEVEGGSGRRTLALPVRRGAVLAADRELSIAFTAQASGHLASVELERVVATGQTPAPVTLVVAIERDQRLALTTRRDTFTATGDARGEPVSLAFAAAAALTAGRSYRLTLSVGEPEGLLLASGHVTLVLATPAGLARQSLPPLVDAAREGEPMLLPLTLAEPASLRRVVLAHAADREARGGERSMRVAVRGPDGSVLAAAARRGAFVPGADGRGETIALPLDGRLEAGVPYLVEVALEGSGALALWGDVIANESSWDDALPLPLDGHDPFHPVSGTFADGLNLELVWADDEAKRERLALALDRADWLVISSNRQVGTLPRLPERFPLTTAYYRNLLGCPHDADVQRCFAEAEPGDAGRLGFELAAVFTSEPSLWGLEISTQLAEEAFTVYDHPRVMIFGKRPDYHPAAVRAHLLEADLDRVVALAPRQAGRRADGLLSPARWQRQQQAGTWSKLFPGSSTINRSQIVATVVWYLIVSLLGWAAFPFARRALPGATDRGFALARLIGLLVLATVVWLLGSAGVPVTWLTIAAVMAMLLGAGAAAGWWQREALREHLFERRGTLLAIEALALGLFLAALAIRAANPDLWHQWRGGEKPMDVSYFTAVLKSDRFPPYDPWFAGGAMNYYYFGFVLVGVPVKLLGIDPAIAYNLILPTLFCLLGLGAWSAGSTLAALLGARRGARTPYAAAALGAFLLLGNLGTARMLWQGWQRLGEQAGHGLAAAGGGLLRWLGGDALPFARGEWIWNPSRALPDNVITEFPFFTFLYGDLHAHLMALPVTVLVVAWALSLLRAPSRRLRPAPLLLGALAIGALRAANTWDLPVYLALGAAALAWSIVRGGGGPRRAAIGPALLIALALLLFLPFARGFAPPASGAVLWGGERSPLGGYLVHWGVFLAVACAWLVWRVRAWLLERRPPARLLVAAAAVLLIAAVVPAVLGIAVAWVAAPLVLLAAALALARGAATGERALAVMIASALALTLAVEVVALAGDIGRMNTVFKLYLQAWTLLSLASAVAAVALWRASAGLRATARWALRTPLALLVLAAAAYAPVAIADRVNDRIDPAAPRGLDGLAYIDGARYEEQGTPLALGEDAGAIRWLRENAVGTPVIVEAHVPEYRWGNRFTVYTGLPGVIGWRWHQQQQRAALAGGAMVNARVDDVARFYQTLDRGETERFLARYGVRFIVLGQLERAVYPAPGLAKLPAWEGQLWRAVYRDGATVLYEVL